ncbi:MAG: HAMP domain-containing sensor histidine kinase [Deltaproteobacteria bacterium]|nr:HAMP domain-containing sensor histidine kinase [Deltaproteobacteria bacterium]
MELKSILAAEKQAFFSKPDRLFTAFLDQYRQATLGSLVKGVVHNLNGSLQILSLHMELLDRVLLQEGGKSAPAAREKVNQCLDQMDKLRTMIVVLMQRGLRQEQEAPEAIHLNPLLEEELALLHHNLFFKHQVRVVKSLAVSLPKFRGHYSDISQGLANLIQNAIESMENTPAKELEIKTVSHREQVEVLIRDTGCGIAEDMRPHLFKPFSSNKGEKHYGLGLFLAGELFRPYGASFSYHSRKGETLFSVRFPLAAARH